MTKEIPNHAVSAAHIPAAVAPAVSPHEWWVFSTALRERWLMLHCTKTGKTASVRDPSREEWSAGYRPPGYPYRWHDESRVVVD